MLEYFAYKKAKKHIDARRLEKEEPILNDDDEAFLKRITEENEADDDDAPENRPPLPKRMYDWTPEEVRGDELVVYGTGSYLAAEEGHAGDESLNTVPTPPLRPVDKGKGTAVESLQKAQEKDDSKRAKSPRAKSPSGLKSYMDRIPFLRTSSSKPIPPAEVVREEDELTAVLDQLDLAAVNNRAFSLSTESQTLLKNFTLVFKDLVNGVPTAASDLTHLLTNSNNQIQNLYSSLPSFLQKLVEKLPDKVTSYLGPEVAAAMAARASASSSTKYAVQGLAAAEKAGTSSKIPMLKDLLKSKGAIITMLRSIMQFLRMRFPALMGMNVLWSLGLFVLLFVLWYCHKRGRETRLSHEDEEARLNGGGFVEGEVQDPAIEDSATTSGYAPEGSLGRELRRQQREKEKEQVEKEKGKGKERLRSKDKSRSRSKSADLR